jgi:hypothetical protein
MPEAGPQATNASATGRGRIIAGLTAPGRGFLVRRGALVATILAFLLMAGAVSPIIHTGMRGDDSHLPVDLDGRRDVGGTSTLGQLRQELSAMFKGGRPQPFGSLEGTLYATRVPERLPYKIGIALLTLAVFLALARFLRMFDVGPDGIAAAAVAFALSMQFRQTHDPALGYYGTQQFSLLLYLAALGCYLRFLRGASARWYVGAFAVVFVLTYETNQWLVLGFACLHLDRASIRRPVWRYVTPFLLFGFGMTLVSAYLRRHATVDAGYQASPDLIPVVLTAGRELVSSIPDIYFLAGSNGLLSSPTKAEALGAFWRAALASLTLWVAFSVARNRPAPLVRTASFGLIGLTLVCLSGLFVALAPQYQQLIFLGSGHLSTLAATTGFVLIAVSFWGLVSRALADLPWARLAVVGAVFIVALAGFYSNLRVVAVERPGIEQRQLFKRALDRGLVGSERPLTTAYITDRDFAWPFGNLIFYGGTADYFVALQTGKKLDVRPLAAPAPSCGPRTTYPFSDCAVTTSRVSFIGVRSARGGGTAFIADGLHRKAPGTDAPTRITAVAYGASARAPVPSLVGTGRDGKTVWNASQERWQMTRLPDGWTRYTATLHDVAKGPQAATITDPRSQIDFLDPNRTAGQTVRLFGTKNLVF